MSLTGLSVEAEKFSSREEYMGLSIRAYDAHRGVSHTSVRKAIRSGRLSPEPDGTIDPVKADLACPP